MAVFILEEQPSSPGRAGSHSRALLIGNYEGAERLGGGLKVPLYLGKLQLWSGKLQGGTRIVEMGLGILLEGLPCLGLTQGYGFIMDLIWI